MPGRVAAPHVGEIRHRQADLFQIVLARRPPGRLPGRLHGRKEKPDEDADDRDYDE